jgi:hypothetical protein
MQTATRIGGSAQTPIPRPVHGYGEYRRFLFPLGILPAAVYNDAFEAMDDLSQTGLLSGTYWLDGFHEKLEGRNGGGDSYRTDGRLAVGVVAIGYVPLLPGSELEFRPLATPVSRSNGIVRNSRAPEAIAND